MNISSPAGQTFTIVSIVGEGFIGMTRYATSLPAQFAIDVPSDAKLGTYALAAVGRTTAGAQVTVTIEIDVERADLPTSIAARVPQVVFDRQGQQSWIGLLATFADGSVLDATTSSRVTYVSSNPSVATVDDMGYLRGVGPGVAEITATYTLATETRQALVRIIVPPPPFALSPNSLDFGEQAVGIPSSLQMTLTNTTADPMSISGVVAVGDYSASSNCVSSSPLDANATCNITVTFTPTTAGLRAGTLQITELEEIFGFSLTGTGTAGGPQVTVTGFTPNSGTIETPVTISGTGFSATPSQNTVTFNGTAATITSSTTTSIETTVPSGATTGPIAVTSPLGSATSAASFTVTVLEPPTITSFSPTIGVAGTSVTITGANFSLTPASNQTKFNITPSTPTASTATSVTAPVPANTASGRIRITTAAGTAVSTDDFIIPPASYTVSDVAVSGRLAFDTATPVTVSTANKIGLWLFDALPGQRISLLGTNGMSGQILGCDLNVSILKYDNSALSGASACMEGSGFIDAKTLSSIGTYTILVDPAGAATGGVTLTLYDVPADYSNTITPGGASVTASMTVPGQNGTLTFSGTAGQRVSLLGSNGMAGQVGLACDVNVSILKPDATVLVGATCMEGSGYINATTLPTTGTYTIVVDPANHAVGNLTLTLHDVPPDFNGSITAGGSAVTVSMPTPGQNATLTFAGTAGQRISLLGTNGMSGQVGLACDVNVTIRKPDSTTLSGATACMEGFGFIDVKTLPVTGTYSIFVDPANHATGNLTLQLYEVTDFSGTLVADGTPQTVTLPTPGQNGALTFSGTSAQRISLRGTNGMSGQIGLACDVNVSILKPDATVLAAPTCMEGTGFIDTIVLPTTGTYTILVDPVNHAVGSLTLALHTVPADTTGTVAIGGSAVAVPLAAPGQNGTLTFSGTSSQQITVRMTGNTFGTITVRLLKPDGTQLATSTSAAANFNLSTQTLPTTGTYTIVIDPSGPNTGTVNVAVTNP